MWRVWAAAFGAALFLTTYFLLAGWLLDVHDAGGRIVPPSRSTVAMEVPWWLTWAALAPLAVWFFRAYPIDRRSAWRAAGAYLAAAIGFALAHGALSVPLWFHALDAPPARNYGSLSEPLRVAWWSVLRSPTAILQFLAFAATFHAVAYARALHHRELAASHLRAALARAELDALKARLEPHFLFNTLNAITSYIRADPAVAERMVTRLARLLRGVLELRDEQEIALARELALVEEYLDIQRLRFGHRLDASVDAEPATAQALVPALLLQPLVENALDHGLARRPGPGRVTISARRDGGVLRLRVEEWAVDMGAARHVEGAADGRGVGMGLSTTRSRLEQLHGAAQRLTLRTGPAGSVVDVVVPFRLAPRAP